MKTLETLKGFFVNLGNKIRAFFADTKKRTVFIVVCVSIFAVTLTCALLFHSYVSDYYAADLDAISDVAKVTNTDIYNLEDGVTVFNPKNAKVGFIFYPGGKVEYTAYAVLMDALASRGALCVLIEMPFNLAVLDVNAADGITEKFPEIESWYIGGHSLGGSMAASYLKNHKDDIDGLVLLGSYSTADLTDSRVLSVFGSADMVMNREKYEKYKKNLPDDFTEVIISGGNHAGFGMYGDQEGDGQATITNLEQINQTVEAIMQFIGEE